MGKRYKNENKDSFFWMYLIAIIMFFLLTFTLLSFMHDKNSPLYLNIDKEIVNANVKTEENVKINEDRKKAEAQKEDLIDKAMDKMGEDIRYERYKAAYDKYYAEQKKKERQEFEQKQRLMQRIKEQERRERLKKEQAAKVAMMQDVVKRQNTYKEEPKQYPQTQQNDSPKAIENKIVAKSMQNSPCAPQSATAIAYFFHPNSQEPIELIFDNPNPSYTNEGVKLVFGDLQRGKEHILKRNIVNLNQVLNHPRFKENTTRHDNLLKAQSAITTTCSPYVYLSKDFYLSQTTPPELQDKYSKESFCRTHSARLPDPIELIPVLLTGRMPAGLYWTSSKVYNLIPDKSSVTRSNLTPTQYTMLIDYDRGSLGFVSEGDYNSNLKAYSLCVYD